MTSAPALTGARVTVPLWQLSDSTRILTPGANRLRAKYSSSSISSPSNRHHVSSRLSLLLAGHVRQSARRGRSRSEGTRSPFFRPCLPPTECPRAPSRAWPPSSTAPSDASRVSARWRPCRSRRTRTQPASRSSLRSVPALQRSARCAMTGPARFDATLAAFLLMAALLDACERRRGSGRLRRRQPITRPGPAERSNEA